MKIIFVSSEGGRQADEDIVQLDIVKCIAGFMDDLDLLEELKTNLVGASWGEGLIAREEMRLQGFTKLFLDKIGPDLIVKGFHHIVLGKVREVFDVTELSVEDEHFAFAVSLNKLNTDCLGPLAYISSSIKLSISHGMIFWEFENHWLLAAIDKSLRVKARVDLAKSSFIEFFIDDEAVAQEEALHLLDDWNGAMLLAALLEGIVYFIFRVHLR